MNEEIKASTIATAYDLKKQVSEKNPEAIRLLEEFSKAALAGDKKAQQIITIFEKKLKMQMVNFYDQGGTDDLDPYLTNEVRGMLGPGHQKEFDAISTIEGALRILEDQLKQARTSAGTERQLINRISDPEKRKRVEARFEEGKLVIKKLAKMKYFLKRLLINKFSNN